MKNILRMGCLTLLAAFVVAAAAAADEGIETDAQSSVYSFQGPSSIVVPGQELGVRRGDVIQEINGKRVGDPLEAADILLNRRSSIRQIRVLRGGKPLLLTKQES